MRRRPGPVASTPKGRCPGEADSEIGGAVAARRPEAGVLAIVVPFLFPAPGLFPPRGMFDSFNFFSKKSRVFNTAFKSYNSGQCAWGGLNHLFLSVNRENEGWMRWSFENSVACTGGPFPTSSTGSPSSFQVRSLVDDFRTFPPSSFQVRSLVDDFRTFPIGPMVSEIPLLN